VKDDRDQWCYKAPEQLPPAFKGGQGRSDEDIVRQGESIFTLAVYAIAGLSVALGVYWILSKVVTP
jgi:hypothetical protein